MVSPAEYKAISRTDRIRALLDLRCNVNCIDPGIASGSTGGSSVPECLHCSAVLGTLCDPGTMYKQESRYNALFVRAHTLTGCQGQRTCPTGPVDASIWLEMLGTMKTYSKTPLAKRLPLVLFTRLPAHVVPMPPQRKATSL